jgi:hypothetical protein
LGLGGEAKAQGLGKFNPSHDERAVCGGGQCNWPD